MHCMSNAYLWKYVKGHFNDLLENVVRRMTNFDTETPLAGPQRWLFPGTSHITGPLWRIIPKA